MHTVWVSFRSLNILKEHNILSHIEHNLSANSAPESEARELVPDWIPDVAFNDPPVSAAVLIALVERAGGFNLVYTLRSRGLRAHSGQIAFPGGKIDATDKNPGAGAVREAHEEIGLEPSDVTILGYMPPYLTGTNYLITPVVAAVHSGPVFVANPAEVDEVFEVPLDFVAGRQNFSKFSIKRHGREHSTWQLIFGVHTIWGITANLSYNFMDLVLTGYKE